MKGFSLPGQRNASQVSPTAAVKGKAGKHATAKHYCQKQCQNQRPQRRRNLFLPKQGHAQHKAGIRTGHHKKQQQLPQKIPLSPKSQKPQKQPRQELPDFSSGNGNQRRQKGIRSSHCCRKT